MNNDKKRLLRDWLRFASVLPICLLYIPALLIYIMGEGGGKSLINSDIIAVMSRQQIKLPNSLALIYLLHINRYYRTLFYHRIGPLRAMLISWLRPGYHDFQISATTKIGRGCTLSHPYATVLNAHSIGDNFSCRHCTTLGAKGSSTDRPIIGNNVFLGPAVTILGSVTIGDNVVIGSGAVVTKDIPSNCIAAGNPARVIKQLE